MQSSMEVPWNSMEFHEVPLNLHEIPWALHGIPWTELHGVAWSCMDHSWKAHETPWSSMKFYGVARDNFTRAHLGCLRMGRDS